MKPPWAFPLRQLTTCMCVSSSNSTRRTSYLNVVWACVSELVSAALGAPVRRPGSVSRGALLPVRPSSLSSFLRRSAAAGDPAAKRVFGSDDVKSPADKVGAGIGRSAERNSTGPPPILSTCARAGIVAMPSKNQQAATDCTIESIYAPLRVWRMLASRPIPRFLRVLP